MLRLDAFAKINLLLCVYPKRRDGFHPLITVFERVSLKDRLTFTLRTDRTIKITSSSPALACDSSNLCFRAAMLLRGAAGTIPGADIHIEKHIPVGSGMGGGSSDAAAALAGLNRLWGLRLSRRKLISLACCLGSDVPFFLYDCPFALAKGRGERITPWNALRGRKFWHIIVVPRINVPTAAIYRDWDRQQARAGNSGSTRLTRGDYSAKLIYLALQKKDRSALTASLYNSLEPVTQRSYPQVTRIKDALNDRGVKTILMSGSGPAVFGIVSSRKEATGVAAQLARNRRWQIFVAQTR